MTAIIVGIIFIGLGFYGLIYWFNDFLIFLRGMFPFSVFVGGILSFIAGIASIQARRNHARKKD